MIKTFKVKVPATTANLGPGFDVLGAALKLYNTVEVTAETGTASKPSVMIIVEGEGKDELPKDEKNIVWKSMQLAFAAAKKKCRTVTAYKRFAIKMVNRIPLASGLGSSAAARLAGILAAHRLSGCVLSNEDIIRLGVELEGHPDNIVPAFAGGFCVSITGEQGVNFIKLAAPQLTAVVCNPNFGLATDKARKVLPKQFTMQTAVFNASRLAFLMAVLQTKKYDQMCHGLEDKFHQPAREKLIPGLSAVLKEACRAGAYGSALSGAGPSVIAFSTKAKAAGVAKQLRKKWAAFKIDSRCFILDFDNTGAHIYR